jgi:hypothetical protein
MYPPTAGQFTRSEEMEMGGLGIDDDGGAGGEGRGLLDGSEGGRGANGEVMFDVGSDDSDDSDEERKKAAVAAGKGKGREVLLKKGEERAKAGVDAAVAAAASGGGEDGVVPYAHRDIKPASVFSLLLVWHVSIVLFGVVQGETDG